MPVTEMGHVKPLSSANTVYFLFMLVHNPANH